MDQRDGAAARACRHQKKGRVKKELGLRLESRRDNRKRVRAGLTKMTVLQEGEAQKGQKEEDDEHDQMEMWQMRIGAKPKSKAARHSRTLQWHDRVGAGKEETGEAIGTHLARQQPPCMWFAFSAR